MAENEGTRSAGLFDIRFIIAALIGLYGIILVLAGLFTSDAQVEKSDGLNINIFAGIGMIVVATAFAIWGRMRPIVVPRDPEKDPAGDDEAERPST